MQPQTEPAPATPSAFTRRQRLFGRWWRMQSPSRQDRFATMAPLISVLLFLAAIVSAFWYLRNEEVQRETEAVRRDTEIVQQQIRLRLIEDQEQLVRMARELVTREIDSDEFVKQAVTFTRERPVLTHLTWLTAARKHKASHVVAVFHPEANPTGEASEPILPLAGTTSEPERTFAIVRDARQPVYSGAFKNATGTPVFQLQVPLIARNTFVGVLIAEYSVESMLRLLVPDVVYLMILV